MKKRLMIFVMLLTVLAITVSAAEVSMTVSGNTVSVSNAPEDSTLFTVAYKNGVIKSVAQIKGEGNISADISSQKEDADFVKAFLWDMKTLRPLSEEIKAEKEMIMEIDGQEIPVIWEDNESVSAIKEEAGKKPITVSMSMYGGWEQVGALGREYPANDKRITAENGDIVLYSSDQIVLFYGSNTWSYTKLGRINLPENEITRLLSGGDVTLILR